MLYRYIYLMQIYSMNFIEQYADDLIRNHPLSDPYTVDSDSDGASDSDSFNAQKGGNRKSKQIQEPSRVKTDDTVNFPTGGFPPIYECVAEGKNALFKGEEEKPARGYSKHRGAVDIKSIMQQRRKVDLSRQ